MENARCYQDQQRTYSIRCLIVLLLLRFITAYPITASKNSSLLAHFSLQLFPTKNCRNCICDKPSYGGTPPLHYFRKRWLRHQIAPIQKPTLFFQSVIAPVNCRTSKARSSGFQARNFLFLTSS